MSQIKQLLNFYKIPLLLSATLAVVLLAFNVITDPFIIAAIVLGSFLGTFLLELDYYIYAYFVEPEGDFSRSLRGYVKDRDFANATNYIYANKSAVTEKTLNSVMFQVVLVALAFYVAYATPYLFVAAFVLSAFLNSVYKYIESYLDGTYSEWFWVLKIKITREGAIIYAGLLVLSLFILITII